MKKRFSKALSKVWGRPTSKGQEGGGGEASGDASHRTTPDGGGAGPPGRGGGTSVGATPAASRRVEHAGERQKEAPSTQRVVRVPAGSAGAPKASGGSVDNAGGSSMAAGRGTGGAAGNGSAAKKLAGKEEEECAICHAGLESDCLATVCAHRFHSRCLGRWLDACLSSSAPPTCPVCRTILPQSRVGGSWVVAAQRRSDSRALVESTGEVAAFEQFREMMDPNNLARAVMPRTLHNFVDRLPTPESVPWVMPRTLHNLVDRLPARERLESDGFMTVHYAVTRLIQETREEASEAVSRRWQAVANGSNSIGGPPTDPRPALTAGMG